MKSERFQLSRKRRRAASSGLLIISSTPAVLKGENEVVAGETTPDAQALTEWSDADIRQDHATPSQVQINLLAGTMLHHKRIFMVV